MPGPVALVGAGEFLASMVAIDRGLLDATGRSRPRVVVLPTASYPDGPDVFARWAEMGRVHFEALGAEVEPVLVRERADAEDRAAAQAIGEADLIYISGGKPEHLRQTLALSPCWEAIAAAHERGAVLVGCSAGAMVLTEHLLRFRRWAPPLRWGRGLGLVRGVGVIPHYDAIPEPFAAAAALLAPRRSAILGIDEGTVAIGWSGTWQVHGSGRVTLWRGRTRVRLHEGESFRT